MPMPEKFQERLKKIAAHHNRPGQGLNRLQTDTFQPVFGVRTLAGPAFSRRGVKFSRIMRENHAWTEKLFTTTPSRRLAGFASFRGQFTVALSAVGSSHCAGGGRSFYSRAAWFQVAPGSRGRSPHRDGPGTRASLWNRDLDRVTPGDLVIAVSLELGASAPGGASAVAAAKNPVIDNRDNTNYLIN